VSWSAANIVVEAAGNVSVIRLLRSAMRSRATVPDGTRRQAARGRLNWLTDLALTFKGAAGHAGQSVHQLPPR
jgi:hypothetical protein